MDESQELNMRFREQVIERAERFHSIEVDGVEVARYSMEAGRRLEERTSSQMATIKAALDVTSVFHWVIPSIEDVQMRSIVDTAQLSPLDIVQLRDGRYLREFLGAPTEQGEPPKKVAFGWCRSGREDPRARIDNSAGVGLAIFDLRPYSYDAAGDVTDEIECDSADVLRFSSILNSLIRDAQYFEMAKRWIRGDSRPIQGGYWIDRWLATW